MEKRHWRLQDFVAHGANVNCLALGRKSGRVMVTGGDDKKVNLWAVGKPNCILSLPGHATAVHCVQFDPREVMVCAGSTAGAMKLWDLEASKLVRTLTGHKDSVKCLDFHPYGDFVASGSLDSNIKLWDARKRGCIYTYKAHSKSVNTLKFSPDGKWIASGGEDCTVKLWDLSAGKVLTEFTGHSGLISDVEFHPNEFLLASGSSDRTVKFWDLESFQLVSSTDGDTLPIRCLCFHTSGTCLFSGSIDSMKVYGWEPNCTYDSVMCGWGKVADMAVSQNQLISGSFSMNSVSIHVVQLSTLNPLCEVDNGRETYVPPAVLTTSSHVRRSFIKDLSSRKLCDIDVKVVDEPSNSDDDIENDNMDLAVLDKDTVFAPRSELCRTPPKSDPFPVPLDGVDYCSKSYILKNIHSETKPISIEKPPLSSVDAPEKLVPNFCKSGSPVRTTYQPNPSSLKSSQSSSSLGSPMKNSTFIISSPSVPLCTPSLSQTYCASSELCSQTPFTRIDYHKPMEKAVPLRRQMPYPPEAVSIVRPTINLVPEKETPQRAVVLPEQLKSKVVTIDFVPQQRDKPAGLDVDEFLPKSLQGSLGFIDTFQPEISEQEAMNIICREHNVIQQVLSHRCQKLRLVYSFMRSKGHKAAMESIIHMNDPAILVDVLSMMNQRQNFWSLDICQLSLPSIQSLIQSKYESYMSVGCEALRLILKRFGGLIKSNVQASPSIGVDLSAEERMAKCKSCYENLLAIRSFILKRQTMQGELGQSFRELLKIMCSEFDQ